MNPPSPSKYPNRDGLPLSQLSPERLNGRVAKIDDILKHSPNASPTRRKQESLYSLGIPQSPSLPEVSMFKDLRMNTDVSGLVKRFEHLDVRDREAESLERKRKQDEALSRARLAREEAESEAARCREELRAQNKEYEECKARERKACRRVEVLMDEGARAKDQWSSQSSIYEKEIRRARKEAFKASSALLKLQEDSKHSQNEANVLRSKLDMADRKAAKSEEEKFTAQYQLVAVQEELEKLKSALRIAEEERDRWKKSLREEDVLRIASQGSIALPDQTTDDIDPPADTEQDTMQRVSLAEIRDQMLQERRRRTNAEGLNEFLQLECRFRCCRCARRSLQEPQHIAEQDINMAIEEEVALIEAPIEPDADMLDQEDEPTPVERPSPKHIPMLPDLRPVSPFLPNSSTQLKTSIRQIKSPSPLPAAEVEYDDRSPTVENDPPLTPVIQQVPARQQGSWREFSTTTKVPMQFTPAKPQPVEEPEAQEPVKSYPFDREAALAAIAYRRGRAKSFAQSQNTPKRPAIDRVVDRRDISAPALSN